MKTLSTLLFTVLLGISGFAQNRYWVAGATGNWNDVANWSATNGGAGGASVPGAANTAIFNGNGLGDCNLDIAPTIAAIQLNAGYTGTIDLLGNTLTLTGTSPFSSGTINNSGGSASVALNSVGTTTFAGTTFGADITGTSSRILFNGSIFNGSVTLTKTDNTTDTGVGGNTFNGATSIGNGGTAELRFGNTNPDTFNGAVTFEINNTGDIVPAYGAVGSVFNNNIVINYNNTGDVRFGANGGTSQLNDPYTITANCAGTGCDDLQLANFTLLSTTPLNLTLGGSGNATLTLGPNSTFVPALTCTAESIIFNTSTLNSSSTFTHTGTNTSNSVGPNTFAALTLNNPGAGDFVLGNSGAGDIFTGAVILNNSGGARIRLGESTAGNVLFGDLTVNNTSVIDVNNRTQISRLAGASTTIHGTTIFNNTGNASDMHISYDAGTSTTFNGPVIINENTSPAGEVWFGASGDVAFNSDITINNLSGNTINFTQGSGLVTFGNGTISIVAFAAGTLRFNNFTQTGTSALNITLTGTALVDLNPGASFNGPVTFAAPQINLDGATFFNNASFEKTGATSNTGNGGNIFHGTTTIKNSSTANFRTDGNNTFNGATTIENTGSGDILLELTTSTNNYNGDLAIINSGTSSVRVGYAGTNNFNGNITVSNTGGTGILFCESAAATATLANSKIIGISGAFSVGRLDLPRFTQVGGTPQVLNTFSGTARIDLGPSSDFGGDLTVAAPQLYLDGAIFRGQTYLEKNGATDNSGAGGNTFLDITTIVNSSPNYLLTANTNPDIFNNNLTVNNTGSSIVYLAHNTANNQFNGSLTFNSTGSSTGIYVCNQTTANATLGVGAQLQIGTFDAGRLQLRRLVQLGIEDQSLLLTNTALLEIGPVGTFNGNVNFSAPQFEVDGVTFNGPVSTVLAKTGASNNDSQGGNTFNSPSTIISNSGTGYFRFATTSLDQFNNDVVFTNTSSGGIRLADNIPGTVFNGNITLNNTGTGGIYFSERAGGTSSIANGKTISIGGLGFNNGQLHIRRFTQSDAVTPQTIQLTGTGLLLMGPAVDFAANVDFRAPQIQMNGGIYNGTAYLEKNGATDNSSSGGNEFVGATTLVNSGSGLVTFGATNPDIFRTHLTVNNTGTERLFLADASAGNLFEGNVTINYGGTTASSSNLHIARQAGATATFSGTLTINCTNTTAGSGVRIANDGAATINGNIIVSTTSGRGISFGTATGSVVQPTGFTFTAGTFSTGDLLFSNFTKGTDATTLNLTGTASVTVTNASTFNGNLAVSTPRVNLNGGIFNGTTSFTKIAAGADDNNGGNTFNGTSTFTNNSTGRWRLANTTADTYNGAVTFVKSSTGVLDAAYSGTNLFSSDITFTSNTALTLGSNTGVVQFTGGNAQSINRTDAFTHNIQRLVLDKSAQNVTLNAPININISSTFSSGILNTTTTNIAILPVAATVSGASNASFVDGPIRKVGNVAFTFPVGDNGFYRPIGISAPTGAAHYFEAQYLNTDHNLGTTANYDPSFWVVSGCEFWNLTRNTGTTSDVSVTLSWQEAACNPGYITTPADLRVTQWNGTMWANQGNGGVTGTATNGTVTSGSAVTTYGSFTIASTTGLNPLPVELLYFKGSLTERNQVLLEWKTASEVDNDYYTIERSYNGQDFDFLTEIGGAGTILIPKTYSVIDTDANAFTGKVYYRLAQTDFSKTRKQLGIVRVQMEAGGVGFSAYPNPVVNHALTVEGKFASKNKAQLVDMLGNIVQTFEWTGESHLVELTVNELPAGNYMLRLKTSEGLTDIKRIVLLGR